MANFREWIGRLRGSVQEVQPDELQEWQEDDEEFVLIDVRESDEIRQGAIPGAIVLPRAHLVQAAEKLMPNKDSKVVAYCAGGVRSLYASESLKNSATAMFGRWLVAFGRWSDIGGEIEKPEQGFQASSGDTPALMHWSRQLTYQRSAQPMPK